ncbi:hypothetical protein G9A89_001935 [Geosiphon pyriformis]|nr:hypothetical protein G9A89_001935 [Geosiphon pyriformis]
MTAYIAKIPKFNREDIETSPQEWLNQVTKAGDANRWNAARMLKTIPYFLKGTADEWFKNLTTSFNDWTAFKTAFLKQFTDNNTLITLQNHFHNIKQEPSESVMTYIEKFNKLLRRIHQLETNNYYFDAQILDQFIAGLKDKLIKKVCSHAPKDLNSAIQHLMNLAIGETSSAAEEKIDQLTKKVKNYFTNQQQQQPQRYQPLQKWNQNNFTLSSNNQPQNQQNRSNQHYPPPQQSYYQPPPSAYYPPKPQYQSNYYQPAPQPIQQQYQQPPTQHYQVPARRLIPQNQFTPQNQYQVNNNRINLNNQLPRLTHYHTQPSYLTIPEEQNFHYTALSKGKTVAQQQNSSYTPTTIPPARITENANLSDIFPFEFEANESPFLLSNAATNEQKAITAIYTEAEVERKSICLILDSGSARSIITYQLMQQLKRNVDRPAQTVIITANSMKKTPVGEIDNFLFTLDEITILVKVLDNTPGYLPLVVHSTNAPKKPWFLNSNWKKKSPLLKHLWHLDQPPIGPMKLNNNMLPEECNWVNIAMREGVCDQTCQYALSISEKVKRETSFNAAYNSTLNKLYHYPHNAEMIFNLAMALINGATKEDVHQMKETEYIEYTMELAGFDYKDEVEVYHQIASYIYPTQEAQIQQLEQMNIRLCEEYIMPCDEQWCLKCYALSIPLPSKNDENEIEFGEPKVTEEIEATPIYFIENQPALQLKYFNNNGQGIKPEKAHEIDAEYDLKYSDKDTLILKPKSHKNQSQNCFQNSTRSNDSNHLLVLSGKQRN